MISLLVWSRGAQQLRHLVAMMTTLIQALLIFSSEIIAGTESNWRLGIAILMAVGEPKPGGRLLLVKSST
ncbi:hypothetical protein [Rhizobium phaseoli]|uniref:hypothetical protein n=1 Tax=Rhizobium phaseoli TaxID=396 RepID=UPI001F25E553|nr:hypothetical protein [Rhizobium phaseoli]